MFALLNWRSSFLFFVKFPSSCSPYLIGDLRSCFFVKFPSSCSPYLIGDLRLFFEFPSSCLLNWRSSFLFFVKFPSSCSPYLIGDLRSCFLLFPFVALLNWSFLVFLLSFHHHVRPT